MSLTPNSIEQVYSDLQQRISDLESYSGEDLKSQMTQLKKALMENPSACALMQPVEIGQMVSALRRITGQHAVEAATKKAAGRSKAKPVVLSEAEMQAAFDEL
jgi:hypothetical protein